MSDGYDSESALLLAVRDSIRERCGYQPHECDVEFDSDGIPPTVGDVYVVVIPGGWEPGPRNDGGGVLDEIIGVDVEVVIRCAGIPNDKRGDTFIDNLAGLNRRIWDVVTTVGHFDYSVLDKAKAYATDTPEGWIEPLRFAGMDIKARLVGSGYFSARPGEDSAGMARTVRFRRARRIQYRSNMA